MVPSPPLPADDGPPPSTLVTALVRWWWLVLLCVVVLCAVGVAAAQLRSPTWSSSVRLQVGRGDLQTQSLPAYAEGTQNLASAYARLAVGQELLRGVARDAGRPAGDVIASVQAAPVPDSPVFTIAAQGPSARAAVRLAQATTSATTAAIDREAGAVDAEAGTVFRRYQRYTVLAERRDLRASRLTARRRVAARLVSADTLVDARAAAQQARLLADTWGARYQQLRTPTVQAAIGATVVQPPSQASSDASSWTQRLGFAGAAAGLLVGLALALGLDARRRRGRS